MATKKAINQFPDQQDHRTLLRDEAALENVTKMDSVYTK